MVEVFMGDQDIVGIVDLRRIDCNRLEPDQVIALSLLDRIRQVRVHEQHGVIVLEPVPCLIHRLDCFHIAPGSRRLRPWHLVAR